MKLLKINLKNFKQYYGEQSIDFAVSDDSSEKNVTVIYGENGRGKTSIYRALIFALYGETILNQDLDDRRSYNNNDDDKIYTVNIKALEEDYQKAQNGIEAFVEVTFLHNNTEYIIKREMHGIKDNDSIFEQKGDITLKYINKDNNTVVLKNKDEQKIDNIINNILDKRMKNYFLFDGEKIENLTKATKEQKNEVSKGIRNLLKIDNLNSSIDALKKLERKISNELKNISTGEYKKKLKDIDSKENEIETLEKEIKKKENNLRNAKEELKKVNNELESFEKYEDKIRNRKALLSDLQELDNNKIEIAEKIKGFNNQAIILVADDLINSAYSKINDINFTNISNEIKEKIANDIIEQMECVCGTKIEMGSPKYNKLLNWKKDDSNQEIFNDRIKYVRDNMIKTIQFIKDKKDLTDQYLKEFAKIDEDIEELNSRIEKLDDEIGNVDNEEFLDKENYKIELEKEISNLELLIEQDYDKLIKLEEELKEFKKDRDKLSEEQNIKNDYTKNLKLVESTESKLDSIKEEFIVEIKENLENKATDIFKLLIDDEKLNTFKKIKVNQDYSLQIYDWNDNPFLANISKGQRQIMSLSFITALAYVAGGDDSLDMPLFMDTPFGRLSGQHRDNLLNEIPKLTPQWILLATDTELTKMEAEELKKTNRWGKIYKLNLIENGFTKIEEKGVNSFVPSR